MKLKRLAAYGAVAAREGHTAADLQYFQFRTVPLALLPNTVPLHTVVV